MRVWNGPSWWSLFTLIITCLIHHKKCWWNRFRHTLGLEQNPCHTSSTNISFHVGGCLAWCNGKLLIKFWCTVSSRELYLQAGGCHRNKAASQVLPQTPSWDRRRGRLRSPWWDMAFLTKGVLTLRALRLYFIYLGLNFLYHLLLACLIHTRQIQLPTL